MTELVSLSGISHLIEKSPTIGRVKVSDKTINVNHEADEKSDLLGGGGPNPSITAFIL